MYFLDYTKRKRSHGDPLPSVIRYGGCYLGLALLASIAIHFTVITTIPIFITVVAIRPWIRIGIGITVITGISVSIAIAIRVAVAPVRLDCGGSNRLGCIRCPGGACRSWCGLRAATLRYRIDIAMLLVRGKRAGTNIN